MKIEAGIDLAGAARSLRFFALGAAAVLWLCAPARGQQLDLGPASGAQIYASSTPNPAWSADQLADGKLNLTFGWLGSIESGRPWVIVSLSEPQTLRSIVLYQATFAEANPRRFARPRDLVVEIDGAREPYKVTLKDLEGQPQRFNFQPVKTDKIKISIESVYAEATIPELMGFQEIEIHKLSSDDLSAVTASISEPRSDPVILQPKLEANFEASGGDQNRTEEVRPNEKAPGEAPAFESDEDAVQSMKSTFSRIEETVAGDARDGELTEEEQEVLDLLHEFTEKFEAYLRNRSK